jgi:hypothetical protein
MVIEDGEAEGLLSELAHAHAPHPGSDAAPVTPVLRTPTLRHVQQLGGLDDFEVWVLLLAVAAEVDARYGRVFAYLNDQAGLNRPTVGLAQAMFGGGLEALRSFLRDAPLVTYDLVHVDREGPLASAALSVPGELWPRLAELVPLSEGPFPSLAASPATLEKLVLPDGLRTRAGCVARWFADRGRPLLVLSGDKGSGRDALAVAIVGRTRSRALAISAEELVKPGGLARVRREALLTDASLIVRIELREELSQGLIDALGNLVEPVVVVCPGKLSEGLFQGSGRPTARLEVPPLDHEARVHTLQQLLADVAHDAALDANELAARFRFGPAQWQASVRLGLEQAQLRGGAEAPLTARELGHAARALCDVQLGALAERLPHSYTWEDLVVSKKTERELRLLRAFGRHAARARMRLGAAARLTATRGVACLFHGPPGTGKTLAAQVLARELDLDLYRIDLSQVVNKYIGESEKNLGRVFDAAEAGNIALLFDEADALFGKRTEVSDAHDRHANLQTSYLLQRMESHPGLTFLATNFRQNMDEAFMRRLQIIAEFPAPEAADRRRLWQRLLPPQELCHHDIDVELLARNFVLSGGHIRNAVLVADALAADDDGPIGMKHLCLAVHRELTKSGRLVDPSAFGAFRELVFASE